MRDLWCRAVVMLVLSMLAAVLLPTPTVAAQETSEARLVTMSAASGVGNLIVDGTRQWLNADCRSQLEEAGYTFAIVAWRDVSSLLATPAQRTCSAIADLLAGSTEPPSGDARLVTNSAGNSAGWVIHDGTKQWLSPGCRTELEAAGGSFAVTPWQQFGTLPAASPLRSCSQVGALLEGSSPPPAGSEPAVVHIEGTTTGWFLYNNARQWITTECRAQLAAEGFVSTSEIWDFFGDLPTIAIRRSCEQISTLLRNPVQPPTGGACEEHNTEQLISDAECETLAAVLTELQRPLAAPPCEVVTCERGSVTRIDFVNVDPEAALSQQIGGLSNLTHLSLIGPRNGGLKGVIPSELGSLSSLTHLELSETLLEGPIPSTLGNLSELTHLVITGRDDDRRNDTISGSIPPELGNLTNLRVLGLHTNDLSGPIPPELGNLTNLESLDLRRNNLSGQLSSALGQLENLRFLDLSLNRLTGVLPAEFGNLSQLRYFSLGANELSGAIPPELGNLVLLQELYLHRNAFTGSIPPELGNLIRLFRMHVTDNQLSGAIPPELGNLKQLRFLFIDNNGLTGQIPPELGNLPVIEWLDLSANRLSGPIPAELGMLSTLGYLRLHNNRLTGEIPPELGDAIGLRRLRLENNNLSGTVPIEVLNLPNLTRLDVSGNPLIVI